MLEGLFSQTTLTSSISSAFVSHQVWLHVIIDGNLATRNVTMCDGSGEDPTCSRYLSAWHGLTVVTVYALPCVAYYLLLLEQVSLRDKCSRSSWVLWRHTACWFKGNLSICDGCSQLSIQLCPWSRWSHHLVNISARPIRSRIYVNLYATKYTPVQYFIFIFVYSSWNTTGHSQSSPEDKERFAF